MTLLRGLLTISTGCALLGADAGADPPECALVGGVPGGPAQAHSLAYRNAVAYLRAQGADAFGTDPAQGVILPVAVAADPFVAGPRSTSVLASLELSSVDARARRRRILANLGLDVSRDTGFLYDQICCNNAGALWYGTGPPLYFGLLRRPIPMMWLDDNQASKLSYRTEHGFGASHTRIPDALDRALVLQTLRNPSQQLLRVTDSILFLLEYRINDYSDPMNPEVSWPLVRDGQVDPPMPDIAVTAEVLLALEAWKTWVPPFLPAPINEPLVEAIDPDLPDPNQLTNVAQALERATTFLVNAVPANAVDASLRIIALIDRWPLPDEPTPPGLAQVAQALLCAHPRLLAMQEGNPVSPQFGSFDGSSFATALAALATVQASQLFLNFAFDTDDDGQEDGVDPDSDGDGYCDPGEGGSGCVTDGFPLENGWYSDMDKDGVSDQDPNETDRDGDGVLNDNDAFPDDAKESRNTDADKIGADAKGDVEDRDDDGDGALDVEELFAGLDPLDDDTDNDSFRDGAELAAGRDGRDAADYPLPDGDIYPLGAPDGVTDLRDALFAFRIVRGEIEGEGELFFERHADVAPLGAAGAPQPDGVFGLGDALVILGRVTGEIAVW